MDFGVTLQTNPPASRVVELTRKAEDLGFGVRGPSTRTSSGRSPTSYTRRCSPQRRG